MSPSWQNNWAFQLAAAALWSLASGAHAAGHRLILFGDTTSDRKLERMAAQVAVDDFNARSAEHPPLQLVVVKPEGSGPADLTALRAELADPSVLGVIALGEEAASLGVLEAIKAAGLPMVMASSWSSPRAFSPSVTWLSPSHLALARIAADYAWKGKKAVQAAVVDNGAPTAVAAGQAFAARFRERGGRIDYMGEWQGTAWGMTRTVKELKANWPQVVFYAGEGGEAGRLLRAMRKERALKATGLLGLPSLLDPAFVEEARGDAQRASVVFPAPDYRGRAHFERTVGTQFARSSPNYKAYVGYAYRKPGAWSAMVFDATKLMLDAIRTASQGPTLTRESVAKALSGTGSYLGIAGSVKFSPEREPLEPKAMVFYALTRVNSKAIRWYDKEFGPPFQ